MGTIHVIGLGPGNIEHLTLESYRMLKNADTVYVRTMKHPVVDELVKEEIVFESFDHIYENAESFEEVYQQIAMELVEKSKLNEKVIFAVPGNPLFAEKTVEILLKIVDNKQNEFILQIYPSMSFLDVVINSLKVDPINGLKMINALNIKEDLPDRNVGNVITQVYDLFTASDVKLALLEIYPGEKEIIVLSASGIPGRERVEKIPLYELDRIHWIDYLTTVYIPPDKEKNLGDIRILLEIMQKLRSDEGCPWDREQTHRSLKRYMIEELYESIDAIDKGDYTNLIEELGDLLLQIVFHCQIGQEEGIFDLKDVLEGINKKLIYRHPHVFGGEDNSYHHERWEELKKKEKGTQFQYQIMEAIPKSMPTLYLAEKVQKKASDVGFDFRLSYEANSWLKDEPLKAIDKIVEEAQELKESLESTSKEDAINEMGDLLFSVVNVSRMIGVDPDEALHKTIDKFIRRFKFIEDSLHKQGHKIQESTLDMMDSLWELSKKDIN